MSAKTDFYATLTAAVNDLALHGYDSAERVAYWSNEIRRAAERVTKSPSQMEKMLRDALETVYRRLVEQGGVLRMAPGVSRYTIERVKPGLRAELDRRIMASASLIRLNRDEVIDKTVRRFQGWATSLPVGGSAEPERAKAKSDLRRSVAGLPFVERRVLIDQGHKLGAAISHTVAVGGAAIAGRWRSNFRQAGYDYRPDHKDRDGKIFLLRGSWALEQGLIKPADGYTDDVTQPAEEPFCRCRFEFLFHLRQLPDDMLTAKGREKLKAVRISA